MKNSKAIKLYTIILVVVMLLSIVAPCMSASSSSTKKQAVATKSSGVKAVDLGLDKYCSIRVSLTTPDNIFEASFELLGAYYIEQNGKKLENTTFKIKIDGDTVSIYSASDVLLYSGTQVNLIRAKMEAGEGYLSYNNRKYLGSFVFDKSSNGYLRIINHVPLAHYLYGVLGGEVGESYPVEAMKAQAIAAKNYVIMKLKPNSAYDIGDTSSEQVYKGYNATWVKIMESVNSTIQYVLTFKGDIFTTFYAASNGGETCLPSHCWGSSPLDDAYALTLDSYDFENENSRMETLTIKLGANNIENNDKNLKSMLIELAEDELDETVESIDSINSVAMNTPAYSGSTRNMKYAAFNITVTADGEEENVSLNVDVALFRTYGVFTDSRLRTYWGEIVGSTYKIYHVRFGHGVGLSQCGSEQRALSGHEFGTILAFYFPNAAPALLNVSVPSEGEVSPTPTPTPTPTPDFVIPSLPGRVSYSGTPVQTAEPKSVDDTEISSINKAGKILKTIDVPDTVTESTVAYAVVNANDINLRSEANTNCETITKLPQGAEVSILNMYNTQWYKVLYGRYLGYISAQYLTIYEYNVLENVSHTSYQTGYINDANVNFRQGASLSATVISQLALNTTAYIWETVTSSGRSWCYVQIGMTYGYVAAQYVNVTGTYGASPIYEGQIVASGVTNDSVNLRKGPSTSYDVIVKLTAASQLLIMELENNWYHVVFNGVAGYVRSDYVTLLSTLPVPPAESNGGETEIPTPALLPIGVGTINTSDVRFREQPSTDASILGTLQQGTQIIMYSLENGWYEVVINGTHGYVYAQYVDATIYTDAPEPQDGLTPAVGITTATVNFRSYPSTSSDVYEKLTPGTKFDIIGETGNWFFVVYMGRAGYLSKQYATLTANGNIAIVTVAEDWQGYATTVNSSVNMRMGASYAHAIIERIPANGNILVLSHEGTWCLVLYDGTYGYVNSVYVCK